MRSLACLILLAGGVSGQTQLTVYNQNFASVKERRVLQLKRGENEVRLTDVTAHLEPDSVILRPAQAGNAIRILEQNYESDPLSEGLLLRAYEGKVLDFEVASPQGGPPRIVKGRILRSGYVPHASAMARYGLQYAAYQYVNASPQGGGQTVVEVDGRIQFGLPGRPVFPSLGSGFLKPTLVWRLQADRGGEQETEFSYLTGGMRWEATYNAVARESGDNFDLIGWVTLENMSGRDFENASIKLMAGDVARANPPMYREEALSAMAGSGGGARAPVTERSFDEYHLYTLSRPATLLDREIKQVEFLRAASVPSTRIYAYDGMARDNRYGLDEYGFRAQPGYGTVSNRKVWTMLEFRNSDEGRLGMPLPAGKVKLYRGDSDGRNEFIGEDRIDHTPKDEFVRLRVGNAFDLAGERRQVNFRNLNNGAVESFEIKVRNHKNEEAEVRVVEHLYRWATWDITAKSMEFLKMDARTVEFRPRIPAGGEAVIEYTVNYAW